MTRQVMIEDYIPVEQISYESSREKVARRRNGHLSTLHLWWARRPLAASRAAIYATFADPARTAEERAELPAFFTELSHWTGPILPVSEALTKARAAVASAGDGRRPRVLDLFAGGGAIPLEALRLGCDAVAVDLNPVAHLIQLCTLVYPQKYGQRLHDAVKKWGGQVIADAQRELGDLYPDIPMSADDVDMFGRARSGRALKPIAYLWTRTIPSPARGVTGRVPLVRQTWLRYKAGNYVAARPVVDREAQTVRFEIVTSNAKTEKDAIAEWGFDPAGLSVRGATTCPFSGTPVTADDVKKAGHRGDLSEQLIAVVCVSPGQRGKVYLGAAAPPIRVNLDERIATVCAEADLTVPAEEIQTQDRLNFKVPLYGMMTWGSLFTRRQQLMLLTLCKLTRTTATRIREETGDADFASAVGAYLGLLVGRVADRGSTLCRWHNIGEKTENVYARQALPMVWDFSEAAPFGTASGDAGNQLELILDCIAHAAAASTRPAEVIHGRAQRLPLADESIDAVVTDPPYYDNISYADLSDFFYVWHKRALGDVFPQLYVNALTPKKAEAVVAAYRHDNKKDAADFYEGQMRLAFAECHRVLRADAPLVCVYAHKTTLGWSTLVDSLRGAGFQVTEAWPLDTEMPDRAGQMDTASLASSIFLVARKRRRGAVGEYATTVRPEMVRIVESRVRELMAVGIGGADLVIASVGAGLRPFTRYDRVELPNGEELPSARFLEEVQREVLETVLAAVFALDRAGVGQVDKASRFYVLARYQYGAAPVEFGEINVLANGLGVELAGPGSLADGAHAIVEINKSAVTLRTHEDRGASPDLGLPTAAGPAPLVDVLHRLLWLFDHDRAGLDPFLTRTLPDMTRLRLLANALKGKALAGAGDTRSDEQKAVDRLLAQWDRLVSARTLFDRSGA